MKINGCDAAWSTTAITATSVTTITTTTTFNNDNNNNSYNNNNNNKITNSVKSSLQRLHIRIFEICPQTHRHTDNVIPNVHSFAAN